MKEINTILSIFFVIALIVIIIRVKNYLKELQEKNKISINQEIMDEFDSINKPIDTSNISDNSYIELFDEAGFNKEWNKIYPTIKDKEYLYFERKKLKAKYTRRVKK